MLSWSRADAGCVRTFLTVYMHKLRTVFAPVRRYSLVFDGSPFNGEDYSVFTVYSAALQLFGAMQPQVAIPLLQANYL